jgi:hypothetical protein
MASGSKRCLPTRFPIGTKLVVEDCRGSQGEGQVYNRYLEFPDGTRVRLPAQPTKTVSRPYRRARATPRRQVRA